MRLIGLRLHFLELPLVAPFTTSFSTQTVRRPMLVEARVRQDDREVTGWGECVALEDPVYSSEHLSGAAEMIRRWIAPRLAAAPRLTAETVGELLDPVVGHRIAKASVEMAVLDAQLRLRGQSFADYLGVTRTEVPSGVSVGIHATPGALVDAVERYVEEGYARIKVKIKPGHDLADVRAVRERFGADLPLQVDANTAYSLADAQHLARLDEFGLLLVEQPLGPSDLRQHAELAKRLRTPICLDESIESAEDAADAISLGAASIVNVKPGRVGGYLEARRVHDVSRAHGVAVWCGGMLETGIGRAANIALAGLPGFTLPGDVSGSDRFYARDIVTEPIVQRDGVVRVPQGPGFGVELDEDFLAHATLGVEDVLAA